MEKRSLADFARELSRQVASGRAFDCLIADDRELRRLNLAFLGNDYATDVLSFPNADSLVWISHNTSAGRSAGTAAMSRRATSDALGEIAISIERADAQARSFGHALTDEIRILMLHGVLHLAGMDHETDHGRMARAELKWRAHFDLPQTLIARTVA